MKYLAHTLLLCAFSLAFPGRPATAAERRPNVIVFLVDDMGWMDCGAYGSKYYETPSIDRLATRGMRFTDAYSANPLCSPTRASILTGKYPARHGITTPSGHLPPQRPGYKFLTESAPANQKLVEPESKHYLEPNEYTIAEALRDAGYRTAHFGKWHLGLTEPHWPERQGFDVAMHGKPDPGPPRYFSPYGFKAQTFADGPTGEYIVDRMTDEAIKFIEAEKDRPFLLHLWQYGVHGPWGHKEEYTRQFAEKKDPRGVQGNPIMASMLKSVDESLGRVMAKLDQLGLTDNTIILFTSDNGGNIVSNTPSDSKNEKNPSAKRAALLADWRKWAGDQGPTNNAPLRQGKGWLYEGGVRVPLVVSWPGVVQPGSTCSTPVSSIDFYPTILAMTGAKAQTDQVIDGQSLVPLLKGSNGWDRQALFNFFPHSQGNKLAGVTVRAGDWKLIRWFATNSEFPDQHELYNLREDLGETTSLAAKLPEIVKELDTSIDGFLKDTGALVPTPNPNYRAPAAKPADPLLGWVPKQCTASNKDGALHVVADGRAPFLANVQFKHTGPVSLQLRVRSSAGGTGKVQWRTGDQSEFTATGQVVSFEIKPGDDWQMARVELPVTGELVHLRLYFPLDKGPTDLSSVQIMAKGALVRNWNFSAAK
jgi:arylsulfatase A-like enzyme